MTVNTQQDDNDNHAPNDDQRPQVGTTGMPTPPEPHDRHAHAPRTTNDPTGARDRVAFGDGATKRSRGTRDDDDDDVIIVVVLYSTR